MRTWLTAIAACAAFGQTGGTPLSFEVASVKPASSPIRTRDDYTAGYNAGMLAAMAAQGLRVVGQRATVTNNTLKDLIRIAYQVKDHQISGPPWIAAEKYEIAAIMPAGASRTQAPEMLRTLLEQRFHLQLHRETRKMAAYALVLGKGGSKLTAAAGQAGRNLWTGAGRDRIRMKSASMAAFVDVLMKAVNRPVVDETGLTELYDFNLTYSSDLSATEANPAPALEEALQEQMGLKLEKREMTVEILVVDRAEKIPTEN